MEQNKSGDITFSRKADNSWISSEEVSPCKRPRRTYAEVVAACASLMSSSRGQPDRNKTAKPATASASNSKGTVRKYVMGLKNKKGTTYFFTRPQKVIKKKKIANKKVLKVPVPALKSFESTPSKTDHFIKPEIKFTPSERENSRKQSTPSEREKLKTPKKELMVEKEMLDWLLENDAGTKKLNRSSSDLDSLATLAQRIKPIVDLEPNNLTSTSTASLVDDWLNKYIAPAETDIFSFHSDRNSIKDVSEDAESLAAKCKQRKTRGPDYELSACPVCFKAVSRMKQHLKRKCMSNKCGFSEEDRNEMAAAILERRHKQRLAVVCQSELINNYKTLNGQEYLKYLITKFEQCGVLVNTDTNNLDQLAPPSQRQASTQTSLVPNVPEASPVTSEYSWEGEAGVNQSWDDVISTPLQQQQQQQMVASTPSKELSSITIPTIALSPIRDVRTPARTPATEDLKTDHSSERTIIQNTTRTSIKSPVVVLERLPVKGKVEVSTPVVGLEQLPVKRKVEVSTPLVGLERLPVKRKLEVSTPLVGLERLPVKRKLEVSTPVVGLPVNSKPIPLPEIKKTKSESSGSTIIVTGIKYTKPVNVKMAALGLYCKFAMDACPILNKFANHLEFTMLVTQKDYRNQIVANVNRVLYNLHPKFENPDALADTEAIQNYFNGMPTDMSSSSKANYIKSLGIFLSFCSQTSTVSERYAKLIEALPAIRECLASIQTGLSKKTSRRMAEKRGSQFRGETKSTHIKDIMNCVEVMKDKYLHYLDAKSRLSQDNLKSINTYFNAVITLKNAHRPSVYTNMLLTEFHKPVKITTDNGDVRYNVGVVDHKTASTQLATVSFTQSEYKEIEKYIANVRVKFENKLSPKTVFLNKNGLKIHNPSMDLRGRQGDLGLPYITSTEARHSFETMSAKLFGPRERTSVAKYLAHSVATASANYVDITEDTIKGMANSMAVLQDPKSWGGLPKINSSAPATAAASGTDPATVSAPSNDPEKVRDKLYKSLKEHFPMECETDLPSKWDIKRIAMETPGCSSFDDVDFKRIRGRLEYDRIVKRVAEAVSAFPLLRPCNEEIVSYLQKKGWYTKDTMTMVTKNWAPSSSTQPTPETSERLEASLSQKIAKQNWRGCVINSGILVANRVLMKGEIICDYHADVLSREEGQTKYDGCLDHTYRQNMFFFQYREIGYCIDGNVTCSCHQLQAQQIKGRCSQNAVEGANAIPRIHWVDNRPHLILQALHTIRQGDAIKFDAGAPIQ